MLDDHCNLWLFLSSWLSGHTFSIYRRLFKVGEVAIIIPKMTQRIMAKPGPESCTPFFQSPSSPKPQRCMGFQLRAELSLAAKWGAATVKFLEGLNSSSLIKSEKLVHSYFLLLLLFCFQSHPCSFLVGGIIGINPHSTSVIFPYLCQFSQSQTLDYFHLYFPGGNFVLEKLFQSSSLTSRLGRI